MKAMQTGSTPVRMNYFVTSSPWRQVDLVEKNEYLLVAEPQFRIGN
jgi:hypothetical protein